VENSVVGAPCGVMDRMASACGEANKLLAMPAEVLGLVDIPSHIRFRGIDSGLRYSIRGADYGSVRIGAFMGRKMIKSTASDIFLQSYSNGNGNNLDELEEFEAIYSNNLSDTLSGEAFLTKYDHHNDPVIVIYNKRPCGVKAATRHPIYENFPVKVCAGMNPFEGSALGMSLLEFFAEARALLTMATTHHGKLKTLKYRLARELHTNLVVSERRIRKHATSQRYKKSKKYQMVEEARSLLHKKVRQRRASPVLVSKADDSRLQSKMASFSSQSTPKESDTAKVSESNVKTQQLGRDPGLLTGRFIFNMCTMKVILASIIALAITAGDGLGLLKWRMQSKDASAVPLTSNFLYVFVSMFDDSLILLEVAKMG
ncbi:arabinose kinase, partial [Tanacetum coccineum]